MIIHQTALFVFFLAIEKSIYLIALLIGVLFGVIRGMHALCPLTK